MSLNAFLNAYCITRAGQSRIPRKRELLEAVQAYQERKQFQYMASFISALVILAAFISASITEILPDGNARAILLGLLGFGIAAAFLLMLRFQKHWSEAERFLSEARVVSEDGIGELLESHMT